jgi:hypothetical protein
LPTAVCHAAGSESTRRYQQQSRVIPEERAEQQQNRFAASRGGSRRRIKQSSPRRASSRNSTCASGRSSASGGKPTPHPLFRASWSCRPPPSASFPSVMSFDLTKHEQPGKKARDAPHPFAQRRALRLFSVGRRERRTCPGPSGLATQSRRVRLPSHVWISRVLPKLLCEIARLVKRLPPKLLYHSRHRRATMPHPTVWERGETFQLAHATSRFFELEGNREETYRSCTREHEAATEK